MRGIVERDNKGHLYGEEPVKYRMVLELDPPAIGRKKDPETESNEIHRVDIWTNNEHVLYWLHALLSRGDGALMPRSEAVILDESSVVIWKDQNKDEKE